MPISEILSSCRAVTLTEDQMSTFQFSLSLLEAHNEIHSAIKVLGQHLDRIIYIHLVYSKLHSMVMMPAGSSTS